MATRFASRSLGAMQNWTSWGEIQKRIDVTSRWNWNRRRAFQALLRGGQPAD